MHLRRIAGGQLVAEEPEVVVAVRILCLSARAYDVDLRGDLVAGTEPGVADQRQDVVGVVVDEGVGIAHGQLLQRVPDPVVRARGGEVVARGRAGRPLVGDHRVERGGHPVHRIEVGEGAPEDDEARPVGQCPDQLDLHRGPVGGGAEGGRVVDQDLLDQLSRVRVVGRVGAGGEDGDEVLDPAVVLGQPRRRAGDRGHSGASSRCLPGPASAARIPRSTPKSHQKAIRSAGGSPLPGPRDRAAGRSERGDRRPRAARPARRAAQYGGRGRAGDQRPGPAARPAAHRRPDLPRRPRHAGAGPVRYRGPGGAGGRASLAAPGGHPVPVPPAGDGLRRPSSSTPWTGSPGAAPRACC